MFKKPFNKQPTAPLRSSDRKQLIAQIAADFGLDAELAKRLVPEGLLCGKASTHLDEPCTIYSEPHTNEPLFVRRGKGTDGVLFPTIYTLLKARSMLPILVTPAVVIEKLRDGADLFQAGVSPASLRALPSLEEGALVAVASINEVTAPRAIGQLAHASRELSASDKGKAVLTLHCEGDYLWKGGSQIEPQELQTDGTSEAPVPEVPTNGANAEVAAPAPPQEVSNAQVGATPAVLSPKEVDAILRTALLLAIKQTLSKDPKAFPIPASSVYSAHVLPCRPATAPVDIKQSSFKKLTSFMKAAQKDGLLTLKETKADLLVLGVKVDHPDVVAQQSYKTVATATKQASQKDEAPTSAKAIQVQELYAPHGPSLAFWSAADRSGDDLMTAHDVRHALSQYITKHELAYKADQKYCKPDEALAKLLGERDTQTVDAVPRNEALEALLRGMQRWHIVDTHQGEPVKRKGPGPRIEISVKQRQGRKVVTIILGLEAFQIDPEELAAALQTLCASSTSVNELPQSTAKKPLHEATVQGDQTLKCVSYLVEHCGVPKGYIDTVPLKKK